MYVGRRRDTRRRRGFRDRERQPRIPTFRPVLGPELEIRLRTQEALHSVQWKDISELRAGREDSRLKRTDPVSGSAISGDLVVGVTHEADKELLGQELRCTPVQVEVDAALILGGRILEIIGKARDGRKLMSCGWVEISIPAAGIDSSMTEAEIGQTH